MQPKNIILISVVIIAFFTMNFHCYKDYTIPPPDHIFEAPVTISPLKKTYLLGDTIWLETDLPSKAIFDTKTNQNIIADTGQIRLGGNFNEFGYAVKNPANGLCDIITINGVNISRYNFDYLTQFEYGLYGCGLPDYKCRIGIKPNYRGNYAITLAQDRPFESCQNKVIRYNSTISYKYKNVDLNLDIFNTFSDANREGSEGTRIYTQEINNRIRFIVKVL